MILKTNNQINFKTSAGVEGQDQTQSNIQKMISALPMDNVNSNLVSPMAHGRGDFSAMKGFAEKNHQSPATHVGNIIKRDTSNLNMVN